jgi:site-specific DNA-methyltransferase (adenine-specific)
MEFMAKMEDKQYNLAICDPPYGINRFKNSQTSRVGKYCASTNKNNWNDLVPNDEYFAELFRVSENQIIWGANNFNSIPPSRGWIFWFKHQPVDNYADGEFAFTSFDTNARCFDYPYYGNINANKQGRIHPSEKPVFLYRWLLKNYAHPGDTILDTHCGSGSILIACDIMGYSIDAYEIDHDYYLAAKARLARHQQQAVLPLNTPTAALQETLL